MVLMFLFCTGLMIALSILLREPGPDDIDNITFSTDTMSAGVEKVWIWIHIGLSLLVGSVTLSIWMHFA